jgi:hypothetical protein
MELGCLVLPTVGVASNRQERSKIRSAQKCYLCLRYVVSPMSPGRTPTRNGGDDESRTCDLCRDSPESRGNWL